MKQAFTLLELIVGIVVIGIAFLSIPAIMTVMNYSSEATVDNKGYYHGLAQMSVIMSKEWDEENTDDWNTSNVVYILNTGEGSCGGRSGLYEAEGRRQCDSDSTNASTIGKDGESDGDFDDIDDFDGDTSVNQNIENSFKISISVNYVDTVSSPDNDMTDNSFSITSTLPAGVDTTNLKQVTVTVKNDTTGTESTLKYIGANIGYDELLSRDFSE